MYFDYNATAPLKKPVLDAMSAFLQEFQGNPSSVHSYGRHSRSFLEQARQTVGDFFAVSPKNVVFTSGATEANNLVIQGYPAKGTLLTSFLEHDSVLYARSSPLNAHDLSVHTGEVVFCDLEEDGVLCLKDLIQKLEARKENPHPPLISLMAANNETGVIQPLQEVCDIARRYNAFVHCDAVQAVGRIPLEAVKKADFITLSAHKIGGPTGIGALVMSPLAEERIRLTPLLRGGGQERFRRAGTENLLGIVGLEAAIKILSYAHREARNLSLLRDSFEAAIQRFCPQAVIFGQRAPRLSNTSNLVMPGVKSEIQLMNFDLLGMAVSSGSACSSGKVKASQVLKAMGVPTALSTCAIRVSFGEDNTVAEKEALVDAWKAIYTKCRPSANQSFVESLFGSYAFGV